MLATFYRKAPLYREARRKRVLGLMSWHSVLIVAVFALSSLALFRYGLS